MSEQYAKASITPLRTVGTVTAPSGAPIYCMFNPREYTISRKVDWRTQPNDATNAGNKVYAGGSPATLSLELFFDTYAKRKSQGTVEDVRKYTGPLWELTQMDDSTSTSASSAIKKPRPSSVLFQWGQTWHFKAVITQMEQQFTLFMPNGTPVRSILKVSFEQADTDTHFYGKGSAGPDATFSVSEGIRDAAGRTGFVGDLRRTSYGKGR